MISPDAFINKYKIKLNELKAKKKILNERLAICENEIEVKKKEVENTIKARKIIIDVALATQKHFVEHVQSLVTMAIRAVFDRDFYFIVNYENKRNKSECELMVKEGENGQPFYPKNEMGGGLLDVISIALRVVMLSMTNPKNRMIIFLDEPLKFVGSSGGLMEKAVKMLKEISERLNVQFIINTHERDIVGFADKSYLVSHNGVFSEVNEISPSVEIVQQHLQKVSRLKRR